VQLRSVDD